MKLNRRHLLMGSGAAIALPFLEAMMPGMRTAKAGTGPTPPKRVIFISTPDGFELDRWKLKITGSEASLSSVDTSASFIGEFGKASNNILDKCLFLEGVPMSSALDSRNLAIGHPGGTSALFTGAFAGPGNDYAGRDGATAGPPLYESVDQVIARNVGAATRFPAMYVGAKTYDNVLARRVFWAKGATAIDPETDPMNVLSTMFANVDPSAAAAAKRKAEESSFLLDSTLDDYKSLRCRLGQTDRQRLDQHMTLIQDLSQRVKLTGGGAACTMPSVKSGLNPDDFAQVPDLVSSMMDLVTMAFACDLTRVVGFEMHAPDSAPDGIYSWLGIPEDAHTLSHLDGTNPNDKIVQMDRWRAQQIMGLVARLQAIKEADGSSLFDNTTILWSSEIGRGWTHDYDDVAWNIIGNGQGYFKTGRYVKFDGTQGSRHNLLLSHYLRYMGVDGAQTVGHPDFATTMALPGIAT